MELHSAAGLNPPGEGDLRERYLERLTRAGALRVPAADAPSLRAIHDGLAGSRARPGDPAYASLGTRLHLATASIDADHRPPGIEDARRGICLVSTPPIRRSTMAPRHRLFSSLRAARAGRRGPIRRERWLHAAAWRRTSLLVLVLAQTFIATIAMMDVLPYHGAQWLEVVQLVLFAILIAWISAGFWTAMAGFLLLLRGRDRYAISASAAPGEPIEPGARTAIVMPICNEDVARVFAGLRATYRSVERTGSLPLFDFFILSDTGDADLRVAEREAWLRLCRDCNCFGRVFYRLRQHRIKRKSGNVADFCRRWGKNYRYMIVLDADSVMSGACLTELVRMMEANPDAGLIQTAPRASGRETLYARIQQFASRTYGPLFVAGMHYWQLGEAHYWGHNAIIRVEPFIEHCALARLPGRGTLSGEILSHDFVEAALMRRAGWGVWIAYDLPGSYEEMPPNLIDELKRDRRWCHGNMINARLFFARGLHPAHRAVFFTGVMAYASAPLWFSFLVLSTAVLTVHTLVEPKYFVAPAQLFPVWPQWHPGRAIELFGATATFLFLPKVLGVVHALRRNVRGYGGAAKLLASAVCEFAFSALLAPIRMLFHTQFVAAAFAGWKVVWKSPPRGDNETTWGEAFRRHGVHTLIGIVWAAFVYWLNPAFLWWLLPVAGALALSIPISVFSSRVSLGRRARAAGLFLIPEESEPPRVLRRLQRYLRGSHPLPDFVDAVVDPLDNAIACASDAARTHLSEAVRRTNEALVEKAIVAGPDALSADDKRALLGDAIALSHLHFAVWTRADAAPLWRAKRLESAPKTLRTTTAPRMDDATTSRDDIEPAATLAMAAPLAQAPMQSHGAAL